MIHSKSSPETKRLRGLLERFLTALAKAENSPFTIDHLELREAIGAAMEGLEPAASRNYSDE